MPRSSGALLALGLALALSAAFAAGAGAGAPGLAASQAASVAAAEQAVIPPPPTPGKLPPDFQRGFTFSNDNWCPWVKYDDPLAMQSLANLRKQVKADWISIIVTWFQDNMYTTSLYPDPWRTAKDAQIAHIVTEAHKMGMKVNIKLHVDMFFNPAHDVFWRGNIGFKFTPGQRAEWFRSFAVMNRYYAALAEKVGADMLTIGTEMVELDVFEAPWREIIKQVRRLYNGKVTYAGNWWGTKEAYKNDWWNAQYSPLSVKFWDALDYIGVDAYFPIAPANSNPSYEQMRDAWSRHVPLLEELHRRYNKDIIFSEIGYVSAMGAYVAPNAWSNMTAVNQTVQTALYKAFFEGFAIPYSDGTKGSWFKGVHWWEWLTDPDTGAPGDWRNLYTPQARGQGLYREAMHHKPVLAVLNQYYSVVPPKPSELTDVALNISRIADRAPFTVTKPFSCDVVAALT